jgi:hypothetical protein
MSTKDSYERGYAKGREWQRDAEEHWVQVGLNPLYPGVPHENDNAAYNEGAKQGIQDEKSSK